MTNEFRIAAMVFGLSTSSALAQDVAAGETSFRKCFPCHAVGADARNKTGPILKSPTQENHRTTQIPRICRGPSGNSL